jgi:hypothetical protein
MSPIRHRPARGSWALFFTVLFLASMWPIYPAFSRIEPVLLGLPFSLVYLTALGVLSFGGMLILYLRDDGDDG